MTPTSKDWATLAMYDVTPDNLTVGRDLYLCGTRIRSLPDNLSVGGYLDLYGTDITALPDNLTVGGWLNLRGTAITALPDNLTVGGWLSLRGTAITALPDNLSVGRHLDVYGTGIRSLPDNLSVGGNMDLGDTPIPVIYHDSRGYDLRRVMAGSEEWFAAGCRFFRSRQEALSHWGSTDYPDKTRGEAYCNAIDALADAMEPDAETEYPT